MNEYTQACMHACSHRHARTHASFFLHHVLLLICFDEYAYTVISHSRPYFSTLNASMVLHLHTYQHFSLPTARLLLNQPPSRTKLGERSFSCAAPRAWNQLPLAVRQCTSVNQFKVALKTHLFTDNVLTLCDHS